MLHTVSAIARICAFAGMVCSAFCQIPSVIQIDIENYAYYYADNPDYSKLAGSQQAVPAVSTKTFSSFIGLADIVRVNGKPAKGTWSIRATTTNYTPAPQPGQAIADTTRNFFVDWVWEIQQVDGTPIGTIMATGMGFGPPRPVHRPDCPRPPRVQWPSRAVLAPSWACEVRLDSRQSQ